MINICADLHTHTLVSNHAFNTITEMTRRACALGHMAMAVTDHGCALPDSPHPWYFYSLHELPRKMEGVFLLRGAEANVLDVSGRLDFEPALLERFCFDWLIVSIHGDTAGGPMCFDDATQLWLNVAQNPFVDMIGHSESPSYAYDYDAVTKAFAKNNKVVEMNANSPRVRPGGEKNMRALAQACMRNGTSIAVNSDAHSIYQLGQVDTVTPMLEEIGFPQELIVNASKSNLVQTLRRHNKPVAALMEQEL